MTDCDANQHSPMQLPFSNIQMLHHSPLSRGTSPHLVKCDRIVRLDSFHIILTHFFLRFWQWLSTVCTFVPQPLLLFTDNIGIAASFADPLAAACIYHRFTLIKWEWQTANWTFAKVAFLGLLEQSIISYFSCSLPDDSSDSQRCSISRVCKRCIS
jgi:hypothetical protein